MATRFPALDKVRAYHEATKHHYRRPSPGGPDFDWTLQPDPFRRYRGAPLIRFAKPSDDPGPACAQVFLGTAPPRRGFLDSIGQLFFDSLSISAWKYYGSERVAMRVNPSSGNLHPIEGYWIDGSGVYHYRPLQHALEKRARMRPPLWRNLTEHVPGALGLIGLTSIYWREAWKYGDRGYRYSELDCGHAIAAVSIAAGALGWQTRLIPSSHQLLGSLFGVFNQEGPDAEEPRCVLAIFPGTLRTSAKLRLPEGARIPLQNLDWTGTPNRTSQKYSEFPWIEQVARATRRLAPGKTTASSRRPAPKCAPFGEEPIRPLIRRRRSAIAFDKRTSLDAEAFRGLLERTVQPISRETLPWSPRVHLVIFVHRVEGMDPGLYIYLRDTSRVRAFRTAIRGRLTWKKDRLPGLYCLKRGNFRRLARQFACLQDIGADGCFSLGMIAEFDRALAEGGAAAYPELFWECGMIGQSLYLEAERCNLRGVGMGCYFDDPVHEYLRIRGTSWQNLYHFAVGGAFEDTRLAPFSRG